MRGLKIQQILTFRDYNAEISGKAADLKNTIRVPVVLAAERVQLYHISELPEAMKDQLPNSMQFVPILKKYSALKEAITDKKELPFVRYHSGPLSSLEQTQIVGTIKNLVADDARRNIKGMAYLTKSKLTDEEINRIKQGDIISVSIDGWAHYGDGGNYKGRTYYFSQDSIGLDYLALLPDQEGRCPGGICGLNMDTASVVEKAILEAKISDREVRTISKITGIKKELKDQSVPTGEVVKGEPIYTEEQNLIEDQKIILELNNITDQEKRIQQLEAENQKLKDSQNAELASKLKDAQTSIDALNKSIELKDAEFKALETKLEDANKKLDEYKETEKQAIIDSLVNSKCYEKEKIKDTCLHDLRVMAKTLSDAKVVDMQKINDKRFGMFDMPDQKDRNAKITDSTNETEKVPNCTIRREYAK